jgi:FlaA1/EpsC-like NDP-sugar epimerase
VAGAYAFAYLVWYKFNIKALDTLYFLRGLSITTLIYLLSFLTVRSYSGIIRHTGLTDALKILKASGLAFVMLVGMNFTFAFLSESFVYHISFSLLIIHFVFTVFLLVGSRVLIKLLFIQITRQFSKEKVPVLIYGAGAAGMITKNALVKDKSYHYMIVAYVDDNSSKVDKSIEGIPVVSPVKAFSEVFVKRNKVQQLIIAMQEVHPDKKREIVEKGLNLNLKVKIVPPVNNWINGELSSGQLRRVKIEDLLEREPIVLDSKNIYREIKNKVVLVTGAAGSIGSEIARQVLSYSPKRLVILDQAESAVFDLRFELRNNKDFQESIYKIEFVIANVKDKIRMESIFDLYRPDVIYHAAAYKHVPLMEENPYEAVMVNIFGTKIVADLAIKYEAEKFVMVSTDKAVNPTNIMGASKRIAEIYIQSLKSDKTKFITTRFGNVLGSNGSVVPLFRKQIEKGGPVTITHKEITRYFMTIPEACNLVMEAGAMGKGGDIFIFDMGEPVKIYNLARKMIQLYGYVLDQDIKIIEIGLRPGEKLYEELLNDEENTLSTHHPKIKRARVINIDAKKIRKYIDELTELIIEKDDLKVVAKMKEIVPEFISNNSVFEQLDKKTSKR